MNPGPRFRMLVEEMTQRHEQFLCVSDTAGFERLVNVVNDHGPDGFPTVGLLQQIVCQGRGRDFRNVLVLADRIDFVLVQSGKGDAISKEIMACSNAPARFSPASVKATGNLRINGSAALIRLRQGRMSAFVKSGHSRRKSSCPLCADINSFASKRKIG
jgi:hypothetical protein